MALTEPIRNKRQLRQMAVYFLNRKQYRNHALLVVGTHTALRISDILRLTWLEVYDEESGVFYSHITVAEKKTGKSKTIALHPKVVEALRLYLPHRRGEYIFSGNRRSMAAISRIQAYRIIKAAAMAVKVVGNIACHSLRKTFGYHAWRSGIAAVLLMDIYNHSSYEITRRYLGISQDDRDKVYLSAALF